MSEQQKNITPMGHKQAAETALSTAIEAESARSSAFLSPTVHALYRIIENDPSLNKKFLHAFLPKILKELQTYAESGKLADISRHQMMINIYANVPEVQKHKKEFSKKISEAGYPWVGLILRRIENGIAAGMQIGNESLLVSTLHDLQRYIAVTGEVGIFGKVGQEVKQNLREFYRKILVTSPHQDPLKVLERREQMDRLIEEFAIYGVVDSGLEQLRLEIQNSANCAALEIMKGAHQTLVLLQKKCDQLREAVKGKEAACLALKEFKNMPIASKLRRAIEYRQLNFPGVFQWYASFDRLNQILEYAISGNAKEQLASFESQLKQQHRIFEEAKKAYMTSRIHESKAPLS